MKLFLFAGFIGLVASQQGQQPFQVQHKDDKLAGKYVWDILKPALTADEVAIILASKDVSYPRYNTIPHSSFSCGSKNQAGFYADVDAQCQVFHRCDPQGNQTDYLCVNSTVFNQITLVCDSWFNVDCGRSIEFENFANSRLYTNLPLFDTPPASYVSPGQLVLLQNQGVVVQQQPAVARPSLIVQQPPRAQKVIIRRQ